MRLAIDHRTTYRFTEPQARLTQLLRLTPADHETQTVTNWLLHVDCDARMRSGRDGFGNRITMLYVDGPIDAIEIAVSGEVITDPSGGVVRGANEPLPPPLFLRITPLTAPNATIAEFAADVTAGTGDDMARLHALNAAIFARFDHDRGRPAPGRTAAQAFDQPRASPRDLAQIFAAAARGLGVPTRYVSGYSPVCLEADAGPAPHGWAEAFVDGRGWVGFDPCAGAVADEAYARIAIALDSLGAAPVAGARFGDGEEAIDVDVHVEREGQ